MANQILNHAKFQNFGNPDMKHRSNYSTERKMAGYMYMKTID